MTKVMRAKRLTKREKAVIVAKDVLAQLRAKKFIATPGCYLKVTPVGKVDMGGDFRDIKVKKCEACAIGSVFMSYARKFDNTPIAEFADNSASLRTGNVYMGDSDIAVNHLESAKGAFRPGDLRRMEDVFEYTDEYLPEYYWRKELGTSSHKTLKALMTNIIRNKGILVIPKKHVKKAVAENKRLKREYDPYGNQY